MKNVLSLKFVFFTLLAVSSIFLHSCNKEEIQPEIPIETETETQADISKSISTEGIREDNGVLIFPSQERFESFYNEALSNQSGLLDFQNAFPGFTSIDAAFEVFVNTESEDLPEINERQITKINDFAVILNEGGNEGRVEPIINNPIILSIVNDKGLLGIGNSIFKATYENTYELPADQIALFESYENRLQNIPGVIIQEVTHSFQSTEANNDRLENVIKECITQYPYGSDQRRVHGFWIIESVFGVNSAIVRVTHEKRRRNRNYWNRDKAPWIQVKAYGHSEKRILSTSGNLCGNGGEYFNITQSASNASKVSKVVDSSFGTCFTFFGSPADSENKVLGDDFSFHTCQIAQ